MPDRPRSVTRARRANAPVDQAGCQLPSKPQSTGSCAVRHPTQTPIAKQARPKIKVRSDTRPHSLMKAVVMAAQTVV